MPALTFDDLMPGNVTPGGVTIGPSGRPRVVIGPDSGTTSNALDFSDLIPESTGDKVARIGKDIGLSALSGLDKGVAGLAGAPADIGGWIQEKIEQGQSKVQGRPFDEVHAERAKDYVISPETLASYGSQAAHANSPLRHDPTTIPGEYAQTAAEFVPAAITGPGNVLRNAVTMGVIPGLASEAAGQHYKGSAMEPVARFLGALAGGGVSALASRPGTAARAIQQQLPDGITPQMVNHADALMQDAAGRGVQLAWPEALSQVAGRPVLTNMMRHLEASPQTEAQMAEFFAGRPQQVQSAARGQFDQLAPVNNTPSSIGPAVGQAGEDIATRIRGAINTATRPMYDAAGQHLVPRQVHAAMVADPLFAQALNAVRNDPARNSFVRGQSDRSVAVYDAVKKELEERAQNAAQPLNPNASQAVASATGTLGNDVRDLAIASERAATNGPSAYQAALATQARLRERYLTPFLNSPLGKAAGRDTTTKQAIEALFPSQPLANSQQEIGQSVRALVNRNPRAAQDLVRAHVEGVFNEATKDLQTGANQAGGAKFRTRLVGNPQQSANLEAAVTALPNGAQRWQGFNRLLDVLEATGTRQGIGSRTSYNDMINEMQKAGGVVQAGAKVVANPMRFLQPLAEKYEQYKLGRNLNELADILTNPRSANLLRAAARAPQSALPSIAFRAVSALQSSRPTESRNSR